MLLITEKLSIFYLLITITIIGHLIPFYLGGKIIGGIKLMPKSVLVRQLVVLLAEQL